MPDCARSPRFLEREREKKKTSECTAKILVKQTLARKPGFCFLLEYSSKMHNLAPPPKHMQKKGSWNPPHTQGKQERFRTTSFMVSLQHKLGSDVQ